MTDKYLASIHELITHMLSFCALAQEWGNRAGTCEARHTLAWNLRMHQEGRPVPAIALYLKNLVNCKQVIRYHWKKTVPKTPKVFVSRLAENWDCINMYMYILHLNPFVHEEDNHYFDVHYNTQTHLYPFVIVLIIATHRCIWYVL